MFLGVRKSVHKVDVLNEESRVKKRPLIDECLKANVDRRVLKEESVDNC